MQEGRPPPRYEVSKRKLYHGKSITNGGKYRGFPPQIKTMKNFVIQGTLPSLNEYLAACNRNPHIGAKMKRDSMMIVTNAIRWQLKKYHTDNPIIIHYRFFEPNMRRDHDNVFAMASKTVQDALQECRVIDNDGWKNVVNFTHEWQVDKKNPRIEVSIEELEDV